MNSVIIDMVTNTEKSMTSWLCELGMIFILRGENEFSSRIVNEFSRMTFKDTKLSSNIGLPVFCLLPIILFT